MKIFHVLLFSRIGRGGKYIRGIEEGLIQIIYLEGKKSGWIALQPVGKDRLSIGLVLSNDYIKQERGKFSKAGKRDWAMELYKQELANSDFINEVLEKAKIIQELAVVSNYSYYSTQKFGKNFALIGDAAAFIDPIFASGVYLALNGAKLIANALDKKFKNNHDHNNSLEAAYDHINGAYELLMKFIGIYYDPDSFNLAEIGPKDLEKYKKHEAAYSLIHYLLAGDFFNNYSRYLDFLDMLSNPKQFARYQNLVIDPSSHSTNSCQLSWEEIFGEMDKTTELASVI